jgi:hypothetical protein
MSSQEALWRERALTAGEADLVRQVFDDALPPDPIRLLATPLPTTFAVATPFDRVVFCSAGRTLPRDFAQSTVTSQAWFIHEMTHLWQVRVGVPIALAKIAALGRRAYKWTLKPGQPFLRYNIEQQAEMVAAAFRLSNRAPSHPEAPALAKAFAAEAKTAQAPAIFAKLAGSPPGNPML